MTIRIEGYSVGDSSVGIGSISFSVDTGLEELDELERENIIKGIIRDIWELHDNGDLKYNFSDDEDKEAQEWDFTRRFSYKDSEKILEERKNETN